MRLGRSFAIAALAFLLPLSASAGLLHFAISGTFDSPTGTYPLAGPSFAIDFDISSDPVNIVPAFNVVELYTTATYKNSGISTPPDPNTYLLFAPPAPFDLGGIYIFLPQTGELPLGLAVQLQGGVPQLYSNTAAAPHFSVGTIDLQAATAREANQGAGFPMTGISNPVLSITDASVPEPPSSLLLTSASVLLFRRWLVR